jgi:hypothetical protein
VGETATGSRPAAGDSSARLLDGTRIPLPVRERQLPAEGLIEDRLSDLQRGITAAEDRVSDVLGGITIPVSRFLNIWRYIRWLLPTWDRLSFQMQAQQQTNWCWAAVSTSVSHYYDASSTWTQCEVANGELGRTDCCAGGASTSCNVYGTLDTSLSRVGHLDHMASGAASFQSVDDEIDAGRPLGIRVAWSGGGAHFLAIIGYLEDTVNYVAVDDPIYGKSDLTFDTLKTSYQGSGSWTHSYYTKA